MYWLDVILIFIIISRTLKGLTLGFLLSLFNITQMILSIILTKKYYRYLYTYITNHPSLYKLIYNMIEFLIDLIFYFKPGNSLNFISGFLTATLVDLFIKFFSIILIFWLINYLLSLVLDLFSFLLKAPVLKQINKFGGMLFGLGEGLIIVYFLSLILKPIGGIFSHTPIGQGILNSSIINFLSSFKLFKLL